MDLMMLPSGSRFRPHAQQVVVDRGQRIELSLACAGLAQRVDGDVELEQQPPLDFVERMRLELPEVT